MNATEYLCQPRGEPQTIHAWYDDLLAGNQPSHDPQVCKSSLLRTHVQLAGSLRIFKANRLWTGRLPIGELIMQEPIHFGFWNDI